MQTVFKIVVFSIAFIFSSKALRSAKLPNGFVEERIVTGLDPTALRVAPDGRLFITEKNGTVRIVENGKLLDDPFIIFSVDNFNERGLGGIEFHPNFEQNGFVYFYYTDPILNRNIIVRVIANGNFAIPGSEETIFMIDELNGSIHMGGDMHFGPDGKLYISVGDGTNGVAPNRFDSLLGKMLRIDEDGHIPHDNPFYNTTEGNNRAIWALGLRNSYSSDIHPETGRLFACDVGGENFEEVNDITKGNYYGWAELEGNQTNQVLPNNYKDPFYTYDHSEGCAIIGASFYAPKNKTFPEKYHDKFFFGDYCRGYIKMLNPVNGEIEETFATEIDRPISIVVSDNGDMYYIERSGIGGGSMVDNTSSSNGSVWKISYSGSGAPFIAQHPEDVFLPIGEDVVFGVKAFGDEPLSYQWLLNGVDIVGENNPNLIINNVQLENNNDLYSCIVNNLLNSVQSDPAKLEVTDNSRPIINIDLPINGSNYRAGDTIFFSGTAFDNEDGILSDSHKTWRIDFQHDDHAHPALVGYSGFGSGEYIIPRIGEVDDNVWYKIYMSSEDSGGLNSNEFVEIFPVKSNFMVNSEPSGLNLNIDGQSRITPAEVLSVEGIERTLAAPLFQVRGSVIYKFDKWEGTSDNSQFLKFIAGEQANLKAMYKEEPVFIAEGTGLTADFFDGIDENDLRNRRPVFSRIDPIVDFDFGLGEPIPQVGSDQFMIRWRGEILAPLTENYTFYVTSDDGTRLWVDDTLIIDKWKNQGATESNGSYRMQGGEKYNIRLEYYEDGGHSSVKLEYENSLIPKAIIPTSQLFPDPLIDKNDNFFVRVYPTSVDDMTTLEISSWRSTIIDWKVFDALGRRCDAGYQTIETGINRIELNIDHFTPGLYYLRVDNSLGDAVIVNFLKQ